MENIDSNLLIDQEWTGTFFPPGEKENSFAGKLKYSPYDGLSLEFARQIDSFNQKSVWEYLHGHTSIGEPLTLVGNYKSENNGIRIKYDHTYLTAKNYPFKYVIFGHHFSDKDAFDTFEFEVSGAQEFFASVHSKKNIAFSKDDIICSKCEIGEVKVVHTSKFDFVGNDIRIHFHSKESKSLDELQEAYSKICRDNSEFHPYLKKSLDYVFRFIPNNDSMILDAIKTMHSIADLFALLSFEPAKLKKISAMARDEDNRMHEMIVFPSFINEKSTIERSFTNKNYYSLPLNNDDIDLELEIGNWIKKKDLYLSIFSFLQSKVHVISSHEVHGNIVLASTQLEGIAINSGKTKKQEKYEY